MPRDAGVIDLGDVVLLPGLINAHTHLEFSDLREPLGQPGTPLPDWIRAVLAERKRANRDAPRAIEMGLQESLQHGVTTVGEIATLSAASYLDTSPRPQLMAFHEAIGFSALRTDSVLADVRRRLESAVEYDDGSLTMGLSPHAPYTVHPQLLVRLVELAGAKRLPIAMHLAESPQELQLLDGGDGPFRVLLEERSMWDPSAIAAGARVLGYLQELSKAPRALVIHGNYLSAEEIEFLAQRRDSLSVVYCPRTHKFFQHRPYPLQTLLSAGVRVALGTDSRASNPDLSLLGEMRQVANVHRDVAPQEIVRMATLAGAEALGLEAVVGSLTPGKRADFTTLRCDAAGSDPYEPIFVDHQPPVQTWLGGRSIGDSLGPTTAPATL